MSAELGLAIAGVAATGAALSKALFGIYHSIRNAPRDVREIATQLELLRSVLNELKRALRKSKNICSAEAQDTIRGLLAQCTGVFNGIEELTAPLRPSDDDPDAQPSFGKRLKWHFKKDDVKLLKGQLDSLKSTIHLMVSIIQLRLRLPPLSSGESSQERTSPELRSALCVASELVDGQRACVADLLLIERHIYAEYSTDEIRFARISAWLSGVVGLSEQGSVPSAPQSIASLRSNRTLSAAQRSITGAATSDVEMLLEKWTTVSNARSRGSRTNPDLEDEVVKAAEHEDIGENQESTTIDTAKAQEATNEIIPEDESLDDRSGSDSSRTETESPHSSDKGRYHAAMESVDSDSGFSRSATPTLESVLMRVDSPHSKERGEKQEANLTPILAFHGDDDNETVRDLRRASLKDRRVRIDLPPASSQSADNKSRVEDWMAHSTPSEDGASVISELWPSQTKTPYQHHTPFSQISILSSQATSEVSSISTIGDSSDPRKVHRLVKLGNNLIRLKKYTEAASLLKEAYNIKKAHGEIDDHQMLEIEFKIGVVFGELGKFPGAERVLNRLFTKQRLALGKEAKATQLTGHYLGRVLSRQQKWWEAWEVYRIVWEMRKDGLEDCSLDEAQKDLAMRTGQEYGQVMVMLGRFDDAAEVLSVIYSAAKQARGEEDARITLDAGINLGRALRALQKCGEAQNILLHIHQLCSQKLEEDNTLTVRCAHELAMVYCDQGEYEKAEPFAQLAWGAKSNPSADLDDVFTLESAKCLATVLYGLDKKEEACNMLRTAHRGLSRMFGEGDPRVLKITDKLTEILLAQKREREAERRLKTALVARRPITQENVDEDIMHISEKLGPLILKQDNKAEAAEVYESIYLGEKKFLGLDSVMTLQNGHQYGTLCFDLHELMTAETVLAEVWTHRKKVLGEKDLNSIESGFKLGQVYFKNNNHLAALNTHQSILQLRTDIFGRQSAEVIESSEVLGNILVSNNESFERGIRLLQDALESKKQIYGIKSTTVSSAMRLATLSACHGRFSDAARLCSWTFDATSQEGTANMALIAVGAGWTAAGFQYVQQHHRQGNEMVHRVVEHIIHWEGERDLKVQNILYGQAALLFVQRESHDCKAVLNRILDVRKRTLGSRHRRTLASAEILAIGTLMDSLLQRTKIHTEIDKVNNWLFARKKGWTMVMRFAMVASILCSYVDLDELAQALLSWLHRTQKRLFGRFDRDTLITLTIHHGLHLRRIYKRAKKTPTKNGSNIDPRVLAPKIWPALTRGISAALTKMTTGEQQSKFFTTWLPKLMVELTLFEGYRRERLTRMFMPQVQIPEFFFTPEFADRVRSQSRSRPTEDDVASKVWTVVSSELGDLMDEKEDLGDKEEDSVDFAEILDEQVADRLRSLGASLIDLTAVSDSHSESREEGHEERAESRMKGLQSKLVSEVISEADIDAAKEDLEAFERETNST
ncbi:hypothetical protein K469DRAFT_206914 [Zopfia rhizophila CBS 207.26]|uniref:Azaphilone pigments biosynthesis cluster protein L N-terminal domain-containing protein n=1 Tax=Zopfia rhizophila CBS 207.26 TaxID=1314779 RepID=A0A6A6DVN3_9PEZI|nr:hypothetical protein K469DRAFT_206914 [Zopfia rhizophila CBS 207.26]